MSLYFSARQGMYTKKHTQRGFSLVELLITIAIILIITTLVMIRYGSFNSTTLLKSQAYEVALNLREAQTYAVSVRGDASQFRNAYGIYFERDTQTYQLFYDADGNGVYSNNEALGDPYALDERFEISGLCFESCDGTTSSMNVTFTRPDFDARIFQNVGSANSGTITISPVGDDSNGWSVTVYRTGQISVIGPSSP